ncbi:hypothetical protein Adt_11851 [Abeliophyllum distichum]|uniref:Uncharacterized protein n=1 Tax=Abeliophyllum distichum TaxID=126358 RepID=A0ABD1UP14_9LAMI
MSSKRPRREMLPSPSFDDDSPPKNCVEKCPILIGKNVDLPSFTYDVPSFHAEDFFVVSMCWVFIITLDEKAYPNLMKAFYQDIIYTPGFSFTEDHYNLLNGRIDSLTSTVDGLQNTVGGLQQSVDGLTSLLQQVLASQLALHSQFEMMFSPPPPSKNYCF